MRITTLVLLTLVAAGAQAAGKSAFINSKVLLEQSPQAIEANTLLKEQFGGREQDLRALARDIQEMEQNYQRDAAIMSAEQKQKAEDEILRAKRRFQNSQNSLREDLQVRQRELLQSVQTAIRAAIRDYGEANGYDFIFTDASIAYASDAVNITDEILEILKQ